jgi:FkbM family methyltransferase
VNFENPAFIAPADALASQTGVVVYGAGPVGRSVARALVDRSVLVRAILDRRAASLAPVAGLPVEAPDAEAARRLRGIPLVLAIFNREVDVLALARSLEETGFGPFVSFVALHAHLGGQLPDRFWLARVDEGAAACDEARAARGLFADDASRSLFDALIAFRRTGNYCFLPAPTPDCIYLPDDVPGWLRKKPVRLLDGGAYDGDTLERFRRAGVVVSAAACFEPDPETFARLVAATRCREEIELLLWPCALAASSGRLRFSGGLGESSRVESAGEMEVPCVAADEVLSRFAPTLVKLDVEGAEEGALAGMTRTLELHRPDLAVSVYHLPAHLWALPMQVAGLRAGYRLFLRAHGYGGFDVVLYAVA